MKTLKAQAKINQGDEIDVEVDVDDAGVVCAVRSRILGCSSLRQSFQRWKDLALGKVGEWPLPSGEGHSEILLREVLLKAQGKWNFPYTHAELCHCRAVQTDDVDRVVVMGAAKVAQVTRMTMAGSGCGSCKTDIESILKWRKGPI